MKREVLTRARSGLSGRRLNEFNGAWLPLTRSPSCRLTETQNRTATFSYQMWAARTTQASNAGQEAVFDRDDARRFRSAENWRVTRRAICREVNGRVSKTNTCLRAVEQRPRGTKTARFRERGRGSAGGRAEEKCFVFRERSS